MLSTVISGFIVLFRILLDLFYWLTREIKSKYIKINKRHTHTKKHEPKTGDVARILNPDGVSDRLIIYIADTNHQIFGLDFDLEKCRIIEHSELSKLNTKHYSLRREHYKTMHNKTIDFSKVAEKYTKPYSFVELDDVQNILTEYNLVYPQSDITLLNLLLVISFFDQELDIKTDNVVDINGVVLLPKINVTSAAEFIDQSKLWK
jgi:hypothetical protein